MKQKYKVFINSQEIEFSREITPSDSTTHYLTEDYNAEELVQNLFSHTPGSESRYLLLTPDPARELNRFISRFQVIRAAGGVVRRQSVTGDVLMIFRHHKWDLPKGKLEKGEAMEEAAVREVEEECGIGSLVITATLPVTWHMYLYKGRWAVKESHWFMMISSDNGEPQPQEEEDITEVRWVPVEKIPALLGNAFASVKELLSATVLNG